MSAKKFFDAQEMVKKTKQNKKVITSLHAKQSEAIVGDLMLIWNRKGGEVFLLLDKIIRSWNQWSGLWRSELNLLLSIRVGETEIWDILSSLRKTMRHEKGQTKR